MLMNDDELEINGPIDSVLNVYCTFAAFNKDWPDVLIHEGKVRQARKGFTAAQNRGRFGVLLHLCEHFILSIVIHKQAMQHA